MGELSQPHDRFFKKLLDDPATVGALLRERLPPEVAALLSDEPPRLEEGSFIDEMFRGTESDRLFSARLKGGEEARIYCLLEHQSTPDPSMPLRLLRYMHRYYEHLEADAKGEPLPPVLPVVVYHGSAPWTVPLRFAQTLAGGDDVRRHCVDFAYTLLDLGPIEDEALSNHLRLRLGLMVLKYAFRVKKQVEILDKIAALVALEPGMQEFVRVYIIETYREVDDASLDAAWRKHMPHLDLENASKIAKRVFAEGKAEGKAETLLRLLTRRFGDLPAETRERVVRATTEQLDQWLDAFVDAKSLSDVFGQH